ncbi:hypothetical protein OEZ86_011046 [Tetradesmus obliquus]|nr:hypothetical protein OEZ86_011046 [Tetradesmus obliquus]
MQVTTNVDTTCTTATPQLQPDHVRSLAKAAGILTSNWIDWLPSYGCALLALQPLDDAGLDLQLLPDHLALHLVCLDDWNFHMHSSTGGAICHTASSASHASLCCGHVPADNFSTLVQTMHTRIEQRRQAKAKAKDNSKSGFQRTPAFILAVIKDALVEVQQQQQQQQQQRSCRQDSMPRGGFTDVGLHTGGMPRATAWPLVQQTLQVVLEQAGVCSQGQEPRSLFRLAMAHFELWLLQGELQQLSPATATAAKLTDCMVMLESVATKAAALAMAGHDVTGFEAACEAARQEVDDAAAQRALQAAQKFQLPASALAADVRSGSASSSSSSSSSSSGSSVAGTWRLPQGVLPAAAAPAGSASGLDAAERAAAAALGSLPVGPGPHSGTLGQMLQQLLQQAAVLSPKIRSCDTAGLLLLSSIEHVLFGCATAGFDKPSSVPASEAEVQLLEQVVDAYREALLSFKATKAEAALMQVQLRSAEVLVVWVAYCMMFEASRRLLPVVNRYGVGLHWTDLRQLVLPDRLAVDAACTVSAYLLQQSNPERQLYSLHDGGKGTLSFAFDNAAQCEDLMEIWLHEQEQAEARVQARWVEVKRKQRLAVQLRKEEARLQLQIAELQPDIAKLQAERQGIDHQLKNTTAQLIRFGFSFVSPSDEEERSRLQQQQAQLQHQETNVVNKLRPLQQRQSTLKAQLTSTETQRLKAEQAPAAIIQPLPQATDCALRWVFLLHTPALLRHLGRCSFLAQQLLLPLPCSPAVAAAMQLGGLRTSLASHYNTYQRSSYHTVQRQHTAVVGPVSFWSASSAPQLHHVGPQHVDCITSADVGVWYPDSLAPAVAWSGTGTAADRALQLPSGLFNPFVPVEQQQLAENFTEKLPATAGQTNSLQWAMLQVGSRAATPAERGNQGIASQDQKPSWLSKPGYLALTNLRSYPLSQLQRLCVALREQSLPLGHPVVLTMHMLQLIVLVKHGDLFLAAAGSAADEFPALRVQCRQVMARRLPAVLAALQQQPAGGAALLTAAVSGVLQRAPSDLQWHQVTGSSSSSSSSSMASFQAVSRDRHLYSVNILDGTVLLDGVPPGRLPSDVLQHPLYRRTFGSCNFEVSVTQAGVWQTLRPINGRLYDFHWSASGRAGSAASQLVIEEVEAATGDRLQLLDVGEDGSCGCWGAELPVMLQQLYSHWYHRAVPTVTPAC